VASSCHLSAADYSVRPARGGRYDPIDAYFKAKGLGSAAEYSALPETKKYEVAGATPEEARRYAGGSDTFSTDWE